MFVLAFICRSARAGEGRAARIANTFATPGRWNWQRGACVGWMRWLAPSGPLKTRLRFHVHFAFPRIPL